MRKKNNEPTDKGKSCWFCANQVDVIDYKDTQTHRRYTSSYFKIVPRRRSGVCAWHQRKLANAIKRARVLSLLPFTRQ